MSYTVSNRSELLAGQKNDPILQDNDNRWVIFPIKYNAIWDHFKKNMTAFWTAEDIDFGVEKNSVVRAGQKASDAFAKLAIYELAANGAIFPDYVDLASNILIETTIAEARAFSGFHSAKEVIHKEVFSKCVELFATEESAKLALAAPVLAHPAVVAKKNFVSKHFEEDASFAEKLIVCTIIKRIFTATSRYAPVAANNSDGSFASWKFAVESVTSDDWLEAKFLAHLHSMLSVPLTPSQVKGFVDAAIKIEKTFASSFIADSATINGVLSDDLEGYIEYVGKLVELDFTTQGGKDGYIKEAGAGYCKFPILSEKHIYEATLLEGAQKGGDKVAQVAPSHQPAVLNTNRFSVDEDF